LPFARSVLGVTKQSQDVKVRDARGRKESEDLTEQVDGETKPTDDMKSDSTDTNKKKPPTLRRPGKL